MFKPKNKLLCLFFFVAQKSNERSWGSGKFRTFI